MLTGKVSDEREVKVPPSEAWKLYGSLELGKLVEKSLPTVLTKIEAEHGQGEAGTIICAHLVPAPGASAGGVYREKFTVVDDEKRVKETELLEGSYLDLGFTLYRVRFEIIEKEGVPNECITRTSIEYELREEAAAMASAVSIQGMSYIMERAADYLVNNH